MDKLVAARRANQTAHPGAAPTRKKASSAPLYFVIGMIVLITLLGLVSLGKRMFFPSPRPATGTETLLDVKIGDPQQEVVDKLKLTKGGPMNPWAANEPPAYLGAILERADLPVPDDELNALDVQRTADDRVCVVFAHDKVIAVVVHKPHHAATGRAVAIGGTANDLANQYGLEGESKTPHFTDSRPHKEHPTILRYNQLGIGFLMEGQEITSITLYPPKETP
jgi:hypothetical protein